MANLRPGTSVTSRATAPPRGGASSTGTWFVVGAAQRGSLTAPRAIRNMSEFQRYYGDRISQSLLWDSLLTYFQEGGQIAIVQRVAGSNVVASSLTLNDSAAAASLKVDAKTPGAWGNQLSVAVEAGAVSGEFVLVVSLNGTQVERSPSLATQTDAVNWAASDDHWVTVSIPGGAGTLDPAVATASSLLGGADDYSGINDAGRNAGLTLFTNDLGPGQVSIPGSTTSSNRAALLVHAAAYNRLALLDSTDSGSYSTLLTEAQTLQTTEYGALFGPWVKIPGLVLNTTRVVPPSAMVAGLIARSDATLSPNDPAAGDNGQARYVVDVTYGPFSDINADSLNSAGLTLIKKFGDTVTSYGLRTLAKPTDPTYLNIGNQRLRMAITADAQNIAQRFLFRQIDGKRQTVSDFGGSLAGMLLKYWTTGALYGDSPDEAFIVDVGESVNTPTTIQNGELHAVLNVRMSPAAEFVSIEIVKTSISQSL